MKLRNVRTASLAALVASALSCSGGSTPSAPAPAPSATVAAASPSPNAAPSASPAATACKYGKGDPDTFCARRNPALLGDVDAAIDRLVQQHPDYFILTDQNGPGGYKVLKPLEYHQGVVSNLQSAGFCAETDTTTVSVRDGKRQVQDGPYAETKEFVGGFVVVDVPNLDAALEWAARNPSAAHTPIEVRPLAGFYFATGTVK